MDLDGVDLDYEYFYGDDQNNLGFSKGLEAQQFLSLVTAGLRQKLPTNSILAHAPMDLDLVPGSAYYDILKNHAHEIDFLMPQYYNGITRPGSDFGVALDHYTVLVDEIFGGDPTKVVFGQIVRVQALIWMVFNRLWLWISSRVRIRAMAVHSFGW